MDLKSTQVEHWFYEWFAGIKKILLFKQWNSRALEKLKLFNKRIVYAYVNINLCTIL